MKLKLIGTDLFVKDCNTNPKWIKYTNGENKAGDFDSSSLVKFRQIFDPNSILFEEIPNKPKYVIKSFNKYWDGIKLVDNINLAKLFPDPSHIHRFINPLVLMWSQSDSVRYRLPNTNLYVSFLHNDERFTLTANKDQSIVFRSDGLKEWCKNRDIDPDIFERVPENYVVKCGGLYYNNVGWTNHPIQAHKFPSMEAAIAFIRSNPYEVITT